MKPRRGDLVICKVKKINPNSAEMEMIDYEGTGLVYASEVAKRWVRDIREFLKDGQVVVCRVLSVDNIVSLSIKRVSRSEGQSKITEYRKENRAKKILEQWGKENKRAKDVGDIMSALEEMFGSVSKGLETAMKKPELFSERIRDVWGKDIVELGQKIAKEKVYDINVMLTMKTIKPDGIDVIKSALSLAEKEGVEVRYVSAPEYVLSVRGNDFKSLNRKVVSVAEKIVEQFKKSGGEAIYKIEERKN